MKVIDKIRKVNRIGMGKMEIKPENITEILRTNFFETYELTRDYHLA